MHAVCGLCALLWLHSLHPVAATSSSLALPFNGWQCSVRRALSRWGTVGVDQFGPCIMMHRAFRLQCPATGGDPGGKSGGSVLSGSDDMEKQTSHGWVPVLGLTCDGADGGVGMHSLSFKEGRKAA